MASVVELASKQPQVTKGLESSAVFNQVLNVGSVDDFCNGFRHVSAAMEFFVDINELPGCSWHTTDEKNA